jgi:hypothetical protein
MMLGWGVPFELTSLFTMNFRIIKFTDFEHEGKKGTAYTVAHAGRVLQVSTLYFEEEGALTATDGKLSIKGDIEVIKKPYVNKMGETVQGLSIMPKFGISLSDV